MMKPIYLAPLEGITDQIYRSAFLKYYGGTDRLFTPFLSPDSSQRFSARDFNEIDPAKNDTTLTVPQLIGNQSDKLLWAAKQIAELGYGEIDLNLGCPSGTVVAKKKGCGLLGAPELLERLLHELFAGLEGIGSPSLRISVKTRLGMENPDEFYGLLDIFNRFPLAELILHPRIRADYYKAPVRKEYVRYALEHSKAPVVYNGEIRTLEELEAAEGSWPELKAVMIGRGLIADPSLALSHRAGKMQIAPCSFASRWSALADKFPFGGSAIVKDGETALPAPETAVKIFREFHDELLSQYVSRLSGETPVLHRMKEFWNYWQKLCPREPELKKIKKSKSLAEYRAAVRTAGLQLKTGRDFLNASCAADHGGRTPIG